MQLRVLIIPDKFKGTLTARQAAEAIAAGWRSQRPADRLDWLPMSDGGDGFGEVLGAYLRAKRQETATVNAAGHPIHSAWWWDAARQMAVIESAQAIGLALLPPGQYHPFDLDTFGLGQLILQARETGARHCVLGIGGSATNDAGFGVLRALGWKFQGNQGEPIVKWTQLATLKTIVPPRRRRWFADFKVAVDVQNPLLGRQGATRVYGPQKGMRPGDFSLADRCFRQLARVAERQGWCPTADAPGTGAAGGLGFGLSTFLGARLTPGFELFAQHAQLAQKFPAADLVITGEGAMDRSSQMGKGTGGIARLCQQYGIPCLGLAGSSPWTPGSPHKPFRAVYRVVPEIASFEQSKQDSARWLAALAARVAQNSANNFRRWNVWTNSNERSSCD
jgi:glycerate kinase